MKRLLSLASVLLLIGAGCSSSPAPTDAPADTPAVEAPIAAPVPTTKPAAKAPVPAVAEERIVKFTKDGAFDPAHVAVHTGGKITWVNESNQNVWVASNPHPVHTNYEGGVFDAKRAIKPTESWSFTFTEAGVWSYHNHLQPGVQGDVQVTPDPRKK